MKQKELEERASERARTERIHIIKLAGQDKFLARSKSMEPGSYFEITITSWGTVRCSCPGFKYRAVCKHAAAVKARLAKARHKAVAR